MRVVKELRKILIVEDENHMREFMSLYLRKEGYQVIEAANGNDGLKQFYKHDIDLVVLDIMMPMIDGFEVCKNIREQSDVPIIVLTAVENDASHIKGYKLGADDYVTKPFKSHILMAKIKRLLEREDSKKNQEIYFFNTLKIDFLGREIYVDNKKIKLAPKEYDLLEYLVINRCVALSRDQILENVWGYDFDGENRVVDAHVKKVRKKLGKYTDCVKTVMAVGYKFEEIQC